MERMSTDILRKGWSDQVKLYIRITIKYLNFSEVPAKENGNSYALIIKFPRKPCNSIVV